MEKPNLEMQLFHPVEPDAEDCRKWQVSEEYRCNVVSSFEWTHGMCGCLALLLYCLSPLPVFLPLACLRRGESHCLKLPPGSGFFCILEAGAKCTCGRITNTRYASQVANSVVA